MKRTSVKSCSGPLLDRAALGIGAVTVVSGASQAAAPGLVLKLVGAENSPATCQLFGTVGMFMTVTGGMLTHSMLCRKSMRLALFWSVVQKAGAVGAVAIGVRRGVFARRALAVAAFDLLSAAVLAAGLGAKMLPKHERTLR
ncbi:hypothetical protein [Glutamicibacter protophormiae]|uniref:DUF1275 domain-containing protein n=1 Tax=Glutamicibacter protophormiae TaxID=37930 RepID=A0ABS4XU44_GLUPR|nr:hypothetical protein [Glutamicibacter protophormiae]MBP2400046.1 hypothetical protein [Glutamicibacter protophormiae]GGL75651.1 hypothetical protein GCM10010038_02160 [Glutamicibacter protophormiae]